MTPDTDSMTPSGDTSMMTDPALWTSDRNCASCPLESSNRRRSVRSRMQSRIASSPDHSMGVPTSSMSRQSDAALTRISIGMPTSLS